MTAGIGERDDPHPDLAPLHRPAAAAALCRLGQPRRAAAGPRPRRARPLPQLGLGRRRSRARLARHRPRPARPRRQRLVDRRPLRHGGARLRPRAADPRPRSRAGHARRAFARRQYRAALRRAVPRQRRQDRRDRGARPVAGDARRARRRVHPRAAADVDRRGPRPRRARAETLRHHRRRVRADDGRKQAPQRRTGAPPDGPRRPAERGRDVQLEVRQLYPRVAAGRHRLCRPRGAVGCDHRADAARLRRRKLGVEPGGRRADRRLRQRPGRAVRARGPLGAPRPDGGFHRDRPGIPVGSRP